MNDRYRLRAIVGNGQNLTRFYRYMDPAGLVVGGTVTPHWMLDGASFWYAQGAPQDTIIFRVDGETGHTTPVFDVAKTREVLSKVLGRGLPFVGLPFDSVVEVGHGRYQFSFERTDYVLSIDSYAIEVVKAEPVISAYARTISRLMGVDLSDKGVPRSYRRPMWGLEPMLVTEVPSPDGRWFASVDDGNLVLRALIDGRTVPLTTDGTQDFSWDIEAPRLNLNAGTAGRQTLEPWSPDGNRLFAIKVDRRAVPTVPIVRYLKRDLEVYGVKMQRAGGPIDIAHPHVIDVAARRALRFDLGDTEDQFFTLVAWIESGLEVLFTRHSRDFKTVDVLAGDPETGSVRTVFSESARTFVALQHDVIYWGDNHVSMLPNGAGLIWRSSRSGWNHFYLYALDGTPICALTQGEFPVVDIVAIAEREGWVYFTAHHDQRRPYDTHLCRVKMTGGEIERLTALDGENVVSISPRNKTFTSVNSRPDRPFRTDFYSCDGRSLACVQCADVSALEELGHVASEEFTVTAADGATMLWGVMHRPADFDANKQYPVIDHLYGGPQRTHVNHHFGLGEESHGRLDRALAQLGYIVICVDARGTPHRSKAFQDVVYRNWGRHEIPDHVATIRQLAQRYPFMDLNRVGVWGHSWGGYFTIRAMAQAPDVYHVGVAASPGEGDPRDGLLTYEPYLDLPARGKAAYDFANNYQLADQIKGNLMIVVGACDAVCYPSALNMTYYLIQAGIDHEFVVIPEAYHCLLGKDDEYFVHKLVKHFETHLKHRKNR